MSHITFDFATELDIAEILAFIQGLAAYENKADEVKATEELLREWIFQKQKAEVLFIKTDGRNVGFALFFYHFSTFLGQAGLFLEDLFVLPEFRHKGYGKSVMQKLAQIALERGCGYLEWRCLNWNLPAAKFYKSIGAAPLNEWTVYRIAGDRIEKLAQE